MRGSRFAFASLIVLILVPTDSRGQGSDPSRLSLDRIYKQNEFGASGFGGRWLPDGSGYALFEPSKEPGRGNDLVRFDPATGKSEVLVPARDFIPHGSNTPLNVEDYTFSADFSKLLIFTNSKRVWRIHSRGDFWVLDRASHVLTKIGPDAAPSTLGYAKFSPDGLKVAYSKGNDLFVDDLQTRRTTRLTQSRSDDEINGSFDWVYEEEFFLRDGFRWSPDSKEIAYWQLNTEGMRSVPLVYSTAGLYPEVKMVKYPKVGETNAACRIGIVSVYGGETLWVKLPGDPSNNYIAYLEWIPRADGQGLFLQQLNRLQNEVRLFCVDGTITQDSQGGRGYWPKLIHTDRDAAWVDLQPNLYWHNGGRHFLWLSEKSGWRHIYAVDSTSNQIKPITSGDYDVMDIVAVDAASGHVYFNASPTSATQRYLYRAKLDGSTPGGERLSPRDQVGTHHDQISPDGKWSIHTFSNFNTPPVIDLVRLPSYERVRVLEDNAALRLKLAKLAPTKAEFFQVTIEPGVSLDGWKIVPGDLDPTKSYPLLVHVYGEPASQSVLDVWTGGNALWHRMLAQEGYVVISVDNRGTPAAKGRAWRKYVYRKVGILAPQDQAKAVEEVLRTHPYLDKSRVGVWGWSGGGSMTLNAMLKYPSLYHVGICIASVPNQRYYDTIYQERYMGLPQDNVDGFTQGSPINFANGLKGKLLLIHGTGDDNCHYQGMEALIDEFIRLDKPFTMMAYPGRSHSIHEGAGTTLHLRRLMTQFLHDNLPVEKGGR